MAQITDRDSLTELIRRAATEAASPREVAEGVSSHILDEDVRPYLVDALTWMARTVMGNQRSGAVDAVRRGRSVSRRTEAVRDYWQNMLDSSVSVGDGEWKRLRDCTADDLRSVIQRRYDHIRAVRGQIDYYETLLKRMDDEGVVTVGELSEPLQE